MLGYVAKIVLVLLLSPFKVGSGSMDGYSSALPFASAFLKTNVGLRSALSWNNLAFHWVSCSASVRRLLFCFTVVPFSSHVMAPFVPCDVRAS